MWCQGRPYVDTSQLPKVQSLYEGSFWVQCPRRVWTNVEGHVASTAASDRAFCCPETPPLTPFLRPTFGHHYNLLFKKDPAPPFTSELDGKGTVLRPSLWSNAMVWGEALTPLGV